MIYWGQVLNCNYWQSSLILSNPLIHDMGNTWHSWEIWYQKIASCLLLWPFGLTWVFAGRGFPMLQVSVWLLEALGSEQSTGTAAELLLALIYWTPGGICRSNKNHLRYLISNFTVNEIKHQLISWEHTCKIFCDQFWSHSLLIFHWITHSLTLPHLMYFYTFDTYWFW